ncbi:MAG TPA: PilZ domain-containing protein [Gammaproteobacteria bacterium]|nr:PilZ domain-containing protein [Gammaproteobacteria bacterium]
MQQTDQRDYPRVESEASVEIVTADRRTYPALVLDVSLTGAQLLCDRPTVEQTINTADNDEITIRMRLKLRNRATVRAQISCLVMSVREVDTDEFRVGLKYDHFHDKNSYQALEDYVDDWLG